MTTTSCSAIELSPHPLPGPTTAGTMVRWANTGSRELPSPSLCESWLGSSGEVRKGGGRSLSILPISLRTRQLRLYPVSSTRRKIWEAGSSRLLCSLHVEMCKLIISQCIYIEHKYFSFGLHKVKVMVSQCIHIEVQNYRLKK
ncbi:hypothetical protein OUZ56_026226 [Daphnia magna]|uniref:Uncharacterized protein n=1 Tax=Daphnia magna TaxID=35525 RepID=A0ABQ9ZMH9_9CRUS|nr:hypothetical protein OUZ56_026226 [Daphnia magna]